MKKKEKKAKKVCNFIFFFTVLSIIIYKLYLMYNEIEINDNIDNTKYEAARTKLSTNYEESVESVNKKSQNIADMLEEITRKCGRNI